MRITAYGTGLWVITSIVCSLGCGGAHPPASPDPPPPAHGYQLKTPEFTLQPTEEKYLCYATKLPDMVDVAVTEFDPYVVAQVHHFEVFRTLSPEQPGLSDCTDTPIKESWLPLFGGGVQAGGLKLPAGSGFQIPTNSQILVQLHLLNATQAPVTAKAIINMTYADNAASVTPAGIYALGTMNINLPPGAHGVSLGAACPAPKAMDVFAVQPHMHQLGTRITLEQGADQASAKMVFQRDPWTFGAQPIDLFGMSVHTGDFIRTTCTYDNTTSAPVVYGESTKNEMCYFVLFYTPFDHLDGCIQ
jgi:hypothetical protein